MNRIILSIVRSALACMVFAAAVQGQANRGLHAGITAQFLPSSPLNNEYNEGPKVLLMFVILNDSDAPADVVAGSWKIVVNGKELEDSGYIFVNGPRPIGGYGTLKPGEYYQLGKALLTSKYFPHLGEYKISWNGKTFHSPTIKVRIPSPDN